MLQDKSSESLKTDNDLVSRIALITKRLRNDIRELGLDKTIEQAASAIPDTKDRLRYVASMTEQAANRVLNAAEQMQPWQEQIKNESKNFLSKLENEEEIKTLDLKEFLTFANSKSEESLAVIMSIIMAQDFQDLTGQVISKMLGVIDVLEKELVQVLLDNIPESKKEEVNNLLNGPQVNPKSEVVTDQGQVDDLLESLGF